MSDTPGERDAQYAHDRELYLTHDPYAGHELELKLAVDRAVDPLELVADLESRLRAGGLRPYLWDPFWSAQKGYVGAGTLTLDTYVFARPAADGPASEAFKVVVGLGKCRLRRKELQAVDAAADGARPFVIDRTEHDTVLDATDVLGVLTAIEAQAAARGEPITYVGHYRRHLKCLACINAETQHRYALMADRCASGRREEALQQIEIEYIWRRAPLGRPFTREELYEDMGRLAGRLMETYAPLSLTRETKFAWLTGRDPGRRGQPLSCAGASSA